MPLAFLGLNTAISGMGSSAHGPISNHQAELPTNTLGISAIASESLQSEEE